ncbi:hypothetical protein B7463_g943, partial [Scytalidium lignicola]
MTRPNASHLREEQPATTSTLTPSHPAESIPMELYRRPSLDGNRSKRLRASRPKVKSGCITCKARRVKCDEAKPQCLRCQKFGRVCDGYATDQPQRVAVMPLQPRIPTLSLYTPSLSVYTTERENRYFQFFCDCVSHELPGFYDDNFWTRIVLQEAFYVPPIRYAAIAIAALSKGLDDATQKDSLKVNIIQGVDKEHSEYSAIFFAKAIRALNVHLSASGGAQLRTALIACILFVCFETLQGSFSSSIQQTYGGLKLLRSHYSERPGSKPWIPRRHSTLSEASGNSRILKDLRRRSVCEDTSSSNPVVARVQEFLQTSKSAAAFVRQKSGSDINEAIPVPDRSQIPLRGPLSTTTDLPLRHESDRDQEQKFSLQNRTQAQRVEITTISDSLSAVLDYPDLTPTTQSQVIVESIRLNGSMLNASARSPFSAVTSSTYTPPSMESHMPSPQLLPPPPPPASQPVATLASRKRPLASRVPIQTLNNDLGIEDSLIRTFVRLEVQGLYFGMIPGIPPLVWDVHKLYDLPIPPSFPDHEAAYHCWDFLQDRALQFFRRVLFNRTYAPQLSEPLSVITRTYTSIIAQLADFETAFRPFLDSAINQDGSVANPRTLVLSLYQKTTIVLLASVQSESEMIYDDYFPSFQYITRISELLISSDLVTQMPPNPRFSFDAGIIPPLHVVGIRCRDPTIRREAISLLLRSPRQEGMWDAILSARIGRWLCFCEEEGLGIPFPDLRSPNTSFHPMSTYTSSSHINFSQERFRRGAFQDGMEIGQSVTASVLGTDHRTVDGSDELSERKADEYNKSSRKPSVANSSVHTGPATGRVGVSDSGDKSNGECYAYLIPEEKRMQLMIVDFHVPDRYIKVKCRGAIAMEDGKRVERETVIAW